MRPLIFILCYLPYWLTTFGAIEHHFEINALAAFKQTSSIDNSEHLSALRFGGSVFFYNNPIQSYGLLEIGADTNLTYLKTNRQKENKAHFSRKVTVLSEILLVRWYPVQLSSWSERVKPFIEVGTGPSYMSNKDFEGRKLGMNFTFQDIGGIGITTKKPNFTLGVYALHYSNAGMHKRNRGITIPVSFKISYII